MKGALPGELLPAQPLTQSQRSPPILTPAVPTEASHQDHGQSTGGEVE